jgi:hypothetical protein
MKAIMRRYLNEIVGLTIMALMTIALVAAQAGTTVSDTVADDTPSKVDIRLSLVD